MNSTIPPGVNADKRAISEKEMRVFVGPRLAREWLEYNTHNRSLKSDRVNIFAEDMVNGKWRYMGDPIRFANDASGKLVLIDGQNRLSAVAKAGVDVEFKVMWGFELEDQQFADIGTARDLSDALSLLDFKHPQITAAVARRVYNWKTTGNPTSIRSGVSMAKLIELVRDDYERLWPAVDFAYHISSSGQLTKTQHGFLYYVLADIDPDQAIWFLKRIEDGANMSANHPIMALRSRLIREREAVGKRIDEFHAVGYAFIAWKAYRSGRMLEKIQLPKGGLTLANLSRPS